MANAANIAKLCQSILACYTSASMFCFVTNLNMKSNFAKRSEEGQKKFLKTQSHSLSQLSVSLPNTCWGLLILFSIIFFDWKLGLNYQKFSHAPFPSPQSQRCWTTPAVDRTTSGGTILMFPHGAVQTHIDGMFKLN